MSRKPNFDVNVDGRTDKRTDGRTEIWTPISHPAISRCDKKSCKEKFGAVNCPLDFEMVLPIWVQEALSGSKGHLRL